MSARTPKPRPSGADRLPVLTGSPRMPQSVVHDRVCGRSERISWQKNAVAEPNVTLERSLQVLEVGHPPAQIDGDADRVEAHLPAIRAFRMLREKRDGHAPDLGLLGRVQAPPHALRPVAAARLDLCED